MCTLKCEPAGESLQLVLVDAGRKWLVGEEQEEVVRVDLLIAETLPESHVKVLHTGGTLACCDKEDNMCYR